MLHSDNHSQLIDSTKVHAFVNVNIINVCHVCNEINLLNGVVMFILIVTSVDRKTT